MSDNKPKNENFKYKRFLCQQEEINLLDMCYRILSTETKLEQIYVPTCVQFKFKSFTSVDFQNLSAMINGVICVNFLIFTHDQNLLTLLLDRLYWNLQEQDKLEINRKKKIERQSYNFVPIFFNKDGNIKLPTTRQKQFQTQAFISPIKIVKSGNQVKGLKITHVIRKQFVVEIIKNSMKEQFLAPFNFIHLNLTLSFDHMAVKKFEVEQSDEDEDEKKDQSQEEKQKKRIEKQKKRIEKQKKRIEKQKRDDVRRGQGFIVEDDYYSQISNSIKRYHIINQQKDKKKANQKKGADEKIENQEQPFEIKKIGFNLLRIEDHYNEGLNAEQKMKLLSPMISCVLAENFGKFNIVSSQMEAFTSDRRNPKVQIEDQEPTQHTFKPFRYAIFKIPLFRFPIVDTLTIFIPLWLLAFISIYIFYQTTEIMNRIINVAGLMIAYAAIQPIVRENIPEATTLTLVDCLFYLQLLINILFLARTIDIRSMYELRKEGPHNNFDYDRWQDPLFLISFALTIGNLLIIVILIIRYKFQQDSFRVKEAPKTPFQISKKQNWTLKLLMDRSFARYKESIVIFDDILARGKQQAEKNKK